MECPPSLAYMTIGRPEHNMHAYIVDLQLRPVPIGVPGELLLSGPRLALGYVGRPDLTAAKFIPNPCFAMVADLVDPLLAPYYKRAYCTGDLARWRSDGSIDFLGRVDRQVKILGVRVELGEVEAALTSASGVMQGVAAAVMDPSGQKRLVGYVIPGGVDPSSVLAHCRSLLVPLMVPSVVMALEAFPLLPNAKLDAKALPVPDWRGVGSEEYVGPSTEVEAMVQRAFSEVLGRPIEELSMLADFFSVGGTSLQVFRLVALLEKIGGVSVVPVSLIHTARTIHGLAQALSAMLVDDSDFATALAIDANHWLDSGRPLSFNQEQMWVLSRLGAPSAYNMPAIYELSDVPDATLLQVALDAVARRHEVLRTRFECQPDGGVVGVVVPATDFSVPVAFVDVGSQEEQLLKVHAEAGKPFDLESDSLIRVRVVVRTGATSSGCVMALTLHHAVGDAWSLGVFWPELMAAYVAALEGCTPPWAPLPIQYGDYAAWQRQQLDGEKGAALRAFWRDTLVGAPSLLQLPTNHTRPARPTFAAESFRASLPPSLLKRLQEVAEQLKVNVQAVLLAGLQIVLTQYSGQNDLVIGVPMAGRDREETHGLIGYFINTLPIRCVASEDATFADIVRTASKAILAAMDHALLPLEEVIAAAGVARIPGVNPLFQVLFQYLPRVDADAVLQLGAVQVTPKPELSQLAHAKMDLTVTLVGDVVSIDYMAELYDSTLINSIFDSFVSVLEVCAQDTACEALGSATLSAGQLEAVARFSMGEERPDFLAGPLIHEAFEAVASESPERRCLCFEGEWLAYGEVERRASVLAGALVGYGVGLGVVVGVMLERSFELVISILAVLKAGGCYLPCDPSYPDSRLAGYLEDAQAIMVLVQAQFAESARSFVGNGVKVVEVGSFGEIDAEFALSRMPTPRAGAQDPAYIIFTSGSSGRPKGVVVPHRALRDHVLGSNAFYAMHHDDIGVLSITINFDPHMMQLGMPLTVGAGLVVFKPGGHADVEYVLNTMASSRVTIMNSTPSLAWTYSRKPGAPAYPPLRCMIYGGEVMPREILSAYARAVSVWVTVGCHIKFAPVYKLLCFYFSFLHLIT